jgi:hypothetical protein
VITGSLVVTGSTISTLGFTGSLQGTASFASNAELLDGKDSTVFATTGSNTFRGNQIISGSGTNTILQVHGANAEPWAFGIYNDTYNPTQSVLAGFVDNTGEANIGTEVDKPLYIYTNANYNAPTLIISSSGVTVGAGGITGSLQGTASWANNATSASNALTASSADNFTVRGTLTAQTIVVQTITSSTDFVTGSTRFGSLLSNTHQFTGSVSITGSLTSPNITGSLQGTASWANNAISASSTLTASYVNPLRQDVIITGSLFVSSSNATQFLVGTGSGIEFQVTNTGVKIGNVITDAHTITGSLNISGSVTATNFTGSLFGTSSWANNATSASFAATSSFAISASWAPSGDATITVADEGITQGTSTYFNFTGAGVTATVTSNTASITISGGGGGSAKAGSGSAASFLGTPRSSSITFGSAFSDNLYAVTVTGEDARSFTIQSKTSTGFTINSNSSVALTGPVYWIATAFN